MIRCYYSVALLSLVLLAAPLYSGNERADESVVSQKVVSGSVAPDNPILLSGDCSDYIDLSGQPLPISVSGTTSGATNDYGPYPSRPACWLGPFSQNAGAGPDVTFKWTVPTNRMYTISLLNSSYDTGLEIYSFTCPVEPVYPADFICGNDDYDNYYRSQLTLEFVQGQSLLIVVDGYGQSAGNFQLEIFYAPDPDSLFAPAVNYGAGINPYSVFAVDLDGDGDNDLAVANGGSNNVSILKNYGDGTFQTPVNYGAGNHPYSVFAVDLDDDEDNDLAVANWYSDNVSILLNYGNGTFQDAVNYPADSCAASVFAADLDRDEDNDLAVASWLSDSVSILMNIGDGTFQAAVNYAVESGSFSVFAAELDGDVHKDLAVANYFSLNVSILINDGNGTFPTPPVNYGVGSGAGSVFAADLDGDDDNDLAVANEYPNDVSILLNNGDGTFQDSLNYGVGIHPWVVFAADLDDDGDNDLATANNVSHNVSILLNNGDGTFQAAVNYWAGANPSSVFAADLDGDGDNDLAVTNENSNNVSILINRTSETGIDDFNDATEPYSVSLSQNYPNPFNAQTTIQYSLLTQSMVSIDVFDILGRKIETITEEMKPAGEHQTVWDAGGQTSGIYFYRIKAGDKVETRKMALLK